MYPALFDYAGIAIQVLALDGTIRQANPACRDIFAYAPEEMVNRNIAQFVAGTDAEPRSFFKVQLVDNIEPVAAFYFE